jgi:hypothetical protein
MSSKSGGTRPKPWMAIAILVASVPLVTRIYDVNVYLGLAPETYSGTLTAHSLAREGDVYLKEYFPAGQVPADLRYAFPRRGEHLVSCEPLFSSMTFAPFMLPYRDRSAWYGRLPLIGAKVAARLAAVSLVVLGLWLLTLASPLRALLVTAVIAFATSHRTITGAGLWTHTSAALWLTTGLLLWSLARHRPALYPLAGTALACATACRASMLPAATLLVVDAWRWHRTNRSVVLATTALTVGVGFLALFTNWYLHGSILGGRAEIVADIAHTHSVPAYFQFSLEHLAGLLISPSRGLFVYSPVLLFALPGLARSLHRDIDLSLRLVTAAGLAIFLLHGFIATWWGGWVFGPRYMTDLLPFFAFWLALTPLPDRRRGLTAILFAGALLWSLGVQQLGAAVYPCGWNSTPVSVDQAPERSWEWRDTQIARCARRWAGRRTQASTRP